MGRAICEYLTADAPTALTGTSLSACTRPCVVSPIRPASQGWSSVRYFAPELIPLHKGAHVFRHSLATQMLKHGGSLREIGEVLRHRNPDTTQIYAKVDISALQGLALPWPGGA
ncbi:MAG: tyrosine-type recombinase/integrase [Comamonadaceae bacterium]|nr:tyrosine-type recombinase/integrase [Comamonadaceae bacterium]